MTDVIIDSTEAIAVLKDHLTEYLEKKGLLTGKGRTHFLCPFHGDKGRPNMALNPHLQNKRASCFSCNKSADIFDFAEQLDGLPTKGEEFFTTTIPAIGAYLGIKISLGPVSETSRQKALMSKLMHDVQSILAAYPSDYAAERGWSHLDKIVTGTVSAAVMRDKILKLGWDPAFVDDTKILSYKRRDDNGNFVDVNFVDSDKFTFVIQDPAGRPIGLVARQLGYDKAVHQAKYIQSHNNLLFAKSKCLFGLHADLKKAKEDCVYIVEGPGDLAALHSNGIYNAVAIMGVALTEEHLYELKKYGIKKITLCLDADEAGQAAIDRFIDTTLTKVPIAC